MQSPNGRSMGASGPPGTSRGLRATLLRRPLRGGGLIKESEFWDRMEFHLGKSYARIWASQQHLTELGSRTVDDALAEGVSCKQVWRAVAASLELPLRDS